jgi:hypothetical protein
MALALDASKLDAFHDDKRAALIANALQAEEEGTPEPVEPLKIESPATSADEPVEIPEAQDQDVPVTEPIQVPAVEPPSGLTDDEIEVFKTLPPTAQKAWARRERDRTSELRRGQDEIANHKKAIEQERLRLAREADTYVNLTQTIDPILAEGSKTDWAKLARDNPAEYVVRKEQYESRVTALTAAMQQRQSALSQQQSETLQREREALVSKVPEWSDPAKHRDGVSAIYRSALERYGFTPEALSAVQDHRAVLVLRDAMAYHELLAKQAKSTQTVQQKRVAEVPKVIRPGAQEDAGAKASERSKAIRNRAMNTRDASQKAALIAQLVED